MKRNRKLLPGYCIDETFGKTSSNPCLVRYWSAADFFRCPADTWVSKPM